MTFPDLRARAEALGHSLPPLLAEAERLAQVVGWGEQGRRRADSGGGRRERGRAAGLLGFPRHAEVPGQSRKGRTMLVLERYI